MRLSLLKGAKYSLFVVIIGIIYLLTAMRKVLLDYDDTILSRFDSHQYLIRPWKSCPIKSADEILLLVCFASSPSNYEERQAIRETWATVANSSTTSKYKFRFLFFLGKPVDDGQTESVSTEAAKYGDIVQADFIDTYRNLTLKVLKIFQWFRDDCSRPDFLIKSDDNSFVNFQRLLNEYGERSNEDLVVGRVVRRGKPLRNRSSRWYISEQQFSGQEFPEYLSGAVVLMTRKSASKILDVCEHRRFFPIEDVLFNGYCRQLANVEPIDDHRFIFSLAFVDECFLDKLIAYHPMNSAKLRQLWPKMKTKRIKNGRCHPHRTKLDNADVKRVMENMMLSPKRNNKANDVFYLN
ncbi:Uncharacterised protein g101 [Pycnogonum litorale]